MARYHAIHFDSAAFDGAADSFANPATAARAAHAVGVGINWYLNRILRISLDYGNTNFEGGAAHGNRASERALLERFQVNF